ncbi:MAG TPA: hypothetical protein PLO65_07765 [Caulobacter sp.]|nr:hypothetical protein [Caulobacter sp.]
MKKLILITTICAIPLLVSGAASAANNISWDDADAYCKKDRGENCCAAADANGYPYVIGERQACTCGDALVANPSGAGGPAARMKKPTLAQRRAMVARNGLTWVRRPVGPR